MTLKQAGKRLKKEFPDCHTVAEMSIRNYIGEDTRSATFKLYVANLHWWSQDHKDFDSAFTELENKIKSTAK